MGTIGLRLVVPTGGWPYPTKLVGYEKEDFHQMAEAGERGSGGSGGAEGAGGAGGFGSVGSGVLEVQGLVLARPGSNTTQLLLCSVVRWTLRPGWFKPGRARCSGPALVVDRFRSDAGPRFPPWLVC